MKPALSSKMVAKSLAAMTSAVEVYNRPSFAYREETFAILALNSWELLLKAKLVKNGGNKPRAIWVYDTKKLKTGKPSTKLYLRRNRTGNPMTLSIRPCIVELAKANTPLDAQIDANLEALVAIRDNATHYFSASHQLAEQIAEISGATVKNFVLLSKAWFGLDFTKSFTLCLPLSFITGPVSVETVITGGEKKLLKYLSDLAATKAPLTDYAVALRIEVKLEKTASPEALKIAYSKDAGAVPVILTEEEIRKIYPWDNATLAKHLRTKIPSFLQNKRYHAIKKSLEKNPKLARERFLDPGNPKSIKKTFYNPNIAAEIESAYKKPVVEVMEIDD